MLSGLVRRRLTGSIISLGFSSAFAPPLLRFPTSPQPNPSMVLILPFPPNSSRTTCRRRRPLRNPPYTVSPQHQLSNPSPPTTFPLLPPTLPPFPLPSVRLPKFMFAVTPPVPLSLLPMMVLTPFLPAHPPFSHYKSATARTLFLFTASNQCLLMFTLLLPFLVPEVVLPLSSVLPPLLLVLPSMFILRTPPQHRLPHRLPLPLPCCPAVLTGLIVSLYVIASSLLPRGWGGPL